MSIGANIRVLLIHESVHDNRTVKILTAENASVTICSSTSLLDYFIEGNYYDLVLTSVALYEEMVVVASSLQRSVQRVVLLLEELSYPGLFFAKSGVVGVLYVPFEDQSFLRIIEQSVEISCQGLNYFSSKKMECRQNKSVVK